MTHLTIIGTSLNPHSKSQVLARLLRDHATRQGVANQFFDLREVLLPFAGSPEGWEAPGAAEIAGSVERSSHVVFAVPIYCYDVNAAAKNLIELIGRSFTEKVVGFICAAGGKGSYMSVMGMANHLMLDFRAVIVPRFLYVDRDGWESEGTLDGETSARLQRLLSDLRRVQVIPE